MEIRMESRTIDDLTIDDIHNLFDSVIVNRGEEYYDDGCVTFIEPFDSLTIKGIVQGNQAYNVSISLDAEGEVLCECTCPCDFNCKHAAAVLLKWLSIKKRYKNELRLSEQSSKESLNQLLSKKSKEELIELAVTMIRKHPEFISLINLEQKKIVFTLKRLFSQFWVGNEVRNLINQLDVLLEGIRRNTKMWDTALFDEMRACSKMIIDNIENVQDEGDFGIFLEDWFQIYGEIFAATRPTKPEKKEFIQTIIAWMEKDDYGYDSSYEKALIGMCTSEEDIEFIKKSLTVTETRYPDDVKYYQQFYLSLYEKIGMNETYLEVAKQSGLTLMLVDKLIALGRSDEALKICEDNLREDTSTYHDLKKIEILKKIGNKNDLAKALFSMLIKTGEFDCYIKLKQESPRDEWKRYFEHLITDAESKGRFELLSRIYYTEKDYRKAYGYTQDIYDLDYLELLAKKLTTADPGLACELFKRLCFDWITHGAGWPYKKSGKMLEAIKRIDKKGAFFRQTKEKLINEHKKKYSLMEVIERI